jgi:thiamine biosynthesis lipoprotein
VLVNLGGDIAVAGGAPEGGWRIGIAAACTTRPADADRVVTIRSGGLASSGTSVRTWRQGRRPVHHIIDPATGDCAGRHWSLVSSVAESCVEANTASTAAVVWGAAAPARLEEMGIPARLVHAGGAVITIGGWPAEPGPGSSPVPISAAHPASRLRREA